MHSSVRHRWTVFFVECVLGAGTHAFVSIRLVRFTHLLFDTSGSNQNCLRDLRRCLNVSVDEWTIGCWFKLYVLMCTLDECFTYASACSLRLLGLRFAGGYHNV